MKNQHLFWILALVLSLSVAAEHPTYGPFETLKTLAPGADIEGMAIDNKGHLWLVDRSAATVTEYDAEGKRLRVLVQPGQQKGAVQTPIALSISPDSKRVAVADGEALLRLYSAETGEWIRNLLTLKYCAPFGFFLSQTRIVYVGRGFKELPAVPPFLAPTVFSTDLEGKDLRVEREEQVTSETYPSFFLLAQGFAVPLPENRWAVCRGLPRELYIINGEGKILKEARAAGSPPHWSPAIFKIGEEQDKALYSTSHPVGIFYTKGLIGVLWQDPPSQKEQFHIEWVDQELHPAGNSPLQLPEKLGPKDYIRGAATDKEGNLYLLVVSRARVLPGESFLFRAAMK
jgi:hypothetical protein